MVVMWEQRYHASQGRRGLPSYSHTHPAQHFSGAGGGLGQGNRVLLSVRPGCLCTVQGAKAGVLLLGRGCKMGPMTDDC